MDPHQILYAITFNQLKLDLNRSHSEDDNLTATNGQRLRDQVQNKNLQCAAEHNTNPRAPWENAFLNSFWPTACLLPGSGKQRMKCWTKQWKALNNGLTTNGTHILLTCLQFDMDPTWLDSLISLPHIPYPNDLSYYVWHYSLDNSPLHVLCNKAMFL